MVAVSMEAVSMEAEKKNPYSLALGSDSGQIIGRENLIQPVIDEFASRDHYNAIRTCTIKGVKGGGKTTLLKNISGHFQKQRGWICVKLDTEFDMLSELAFQIRRVEELADWLGDAQIEVVLHGRQVELRREGEPVWNAGDAAGCMIRVLSEHGRRVLICVDDMTVNKNMKVFCETFQTYIWKRLPVYLLVAGDSEQAEILSKNRSLSSICGVKIDAGALNRQAMADNYRKVLGVSREDADSMAALTKGYAYSFQVLGYWTWMKGSDYKAALEEHYYSLTENVYRKMWSGLSWTDQRVIRAIARAPRKRNKEIRQILGWDTDHYNPYRMRLVRKGIADGATYGHLYFTLPGFEAFVLRYVTGA